MRLLSFFAPAWRGKNNVVLMLLSMDGLRAAVVNWEEVASLVVRRLRSELSAVRTRDRSDDEMLERVIAAEAELSQSRATTPLPYAILVPVSLRRGELRIELFTTITTLGTPLDITLQELRIETLFPATARSRTALEAMMRAEGD